MKQIVVSTLNFREAALPEVLAFFCAASWEYPNLQGKLHHHPIQFKLAQSPLLPEETHATARTVTFSARYVTLYDAVKTVADFTDCEMHTFDNLVTFIPIPAANTPFTNHNFRVSRDQITSLLGYPPANNERPINLVEHFTEPFAARHVAIPAASIITWLPPVNELRISTTPSLLAEIVKQLQTAGITTPGQPDLLGYTLYRLPTETAANNTSTLDPHIDHGVGDPFGAGAGANNTSTLDLHIDTTPYADIHKTLLNKTLPRPQHIYPQAFLNYFDYHDLHPITATYRITVEGSPSPFSPNHHLLRIGIKGQRHGREEQRPARYTILINTSDSMNRPDRIGLIHTSLPHAITKMAPDDHLQLLSFNDRTQLLLPPTSPANTAEIISAINNLTCQNSADFPTALRLAALAATRIFRPGADNRIIILTDNSATPDQTTTTQLTLEVAALCRQGITSSLLIFGQNPSSTPPLADLAHAGDGSYHLIPDTTTAHQLLTDELTATSHTIALESNIEIRWDPAVVAQFRLFGYESLPRPQNDGFGVVKSFWPDPFDAHTDPFTPASAITSPRRHILSGKSLSILYEIACHPDADPNRPLALITINSVIPPDNLQNSVREEIRPHHFYPSFQAARPEFRLAVTATHFAELLRRSPYVAHLNFPLIADLLKPIATELPRDNRITDLLDLVNIATTLTTPRELVNDSHLTPTHPEISHE